MKTASLNLLKEISSNMPFPSPIHAAILVSLSTSLSSFVTENGLGRVLGGNAPFVLERHPDGKDTVRGLDIAFISSARWPEAFAAKAGSSRLTWRSKSFLPATEQMTSKRKSMQIAPGGYNLDLDRISRFAHRHHPHR